MQLDIVQKPRDLCGECAWIVGIEDVYAACGNDGEPRFTCVIDPRYAPGYLAWVVNDGEEIHVGVGGYADRFDPRSALAAFTDRVARIEPLTGLALIR